MKRLVMVLMVLVVMVFVSCVFSTNDELDDFETSPSHFITFEEVSQPYLDEHGEPEEIIEFISGSYHSIDWWYWSKDFMIGFLLSPYDDIYGWTVDCIYSF